MATPTSDRLVERAIYVWNEAGGNWIAWDGVVTSGGVTNYATQLDEAAGSITYVGKAAIGSATSASAWRIFRMDESGDPELVITWADGDDSFDNIWDNRASLTYS